MNRKSKLVLREKMIKYFQMFPNFQILGCLMKRWVKSKNGKDKKNITKGKWEKIKKGEKNIYKHKDCSFLGFITCKNSKLNAYKHFLSTN